MINIYFRIHSYAVTSTPNSVIYFGGDESGMVAGNESGQETDRVAEYKNLKWNILGKLARPRSAHHSIKMGNKIYLLGGLGAT